MTAIIPSEIASITTVPEETFHLEYKMTKHDHCYRLVLSPTAENAEIACNSNSIILPAITTTTRVCVACDYYIIFECDYIIITIIIIVVVIIIIIIIIIIAWQ